MSAKYYLGVDGGATKTEVALLARDGSFIGGARGPGTYLTARASKGVLRTLESLIEQVCRRHKVTAKQIAHYGFGLCGVDYPDEFRSQCTSLLRPLAIPADRAEIVNDGIAALWGGARSPQALVLQIGTGYTAAYRLAYGQETPFDQVNCGVVVNLRRDVLSFAARSLDGREEPSVLPKLLLVYFGESDPMVLVKKLRRERYPREKVMNVLEVLNRAVKKQDSVALKIVERAAGHYAWDIRTLIGKIGREKVEVVLGGGVLLNGPPRLLRRIGQLVRQDHPRARVHKPHLPPAIGAAILAGFSDGANPKTLFTQAKKTLDCWP